MQFLDKKHYFFGGGGHMSPYQVEFAEFAVLRTLLSSLPAEC